MSSPECFYREDSDLGQGVSSGITELPVINISQVRRPKCVLRMFEDDEVCLNPTLSEEECPIAREYFKEIDALRGQKVSEM